MYFGLSEEQQFFQESINKFLEDNVTVDALKAYRTGENKDLTCLLYTSPSPRDATLSRMPSSA